MPPDIITEDKVVLHAADRAFNYYDMQPGTIVEDPDSSGWFLFRHDDGSTKLLNGERICSLEFAKRKGWGFWP